MDLRAEHIFLLFLPFWLVAGEQQPNLEFQPFVSKHEGVIWVDVRERESVLYWKKAIDDFLEPYRRPDNSSNIVSCDRHFPAPKGKYCDFDLRALGPCAPGHDYGYQRANLCIFLSLTKVPGWTPQYYNSTTLPSNAPQSLKEFVKSTEGVEPRSMVYVSCEGGNAADIEYLGPIRYYPAQGFEGYFFPLNGPLAPLVAVQLERPNYGIVLNLVCTAWAKNIARDQKKNLGSVSIELMID